MSEEGEPSEPRARSALLLGASGLVGGYCLELLLESPRYDRIRILSRRRLPHRHPKLEQNVVDFEALADHEALFEVDDVFCCLGTTMATAGSAEAFRRVDHDYVVEAARLAAERGADQFLVVSALGADPSSRVFYNRVKGEMEVAVKHEPFRALWIVRPALLRGERSEVRFAERIGLWLAGALRFVLVGRLRRYRAVEARAVAAALVGLAAGEGTGGVVESEEIPALAARA